MHLGNIFIECRKKLTRNYIGSLPGRSGFGRGNNQGMALSQSPINCSAMF